MEPCFVFSGNWTPTGEWVGKEGLERGRSLTFSKVGKICIRAQPKPETKVLGKETEVETQLYGFWQHKKIQENVYNIS